MSFGSQYSHLDSLILSFLELQGKLVCFQGAIPRKIDELHEIQSQFGDIMTDEYNSVLLQFFYDVDPEVRKLFLDLANLTAGMGTSNLQDLIKARVYYLLETNAIEMSDYIPCLNEGFASDYESWWGGGCGFWDYASAVGSGVGAVLAVGGAFTTSVGTFGLASVPAAAGATIAVANAVNTIGSLVERCSS